MTIRGKDYLLGPWQSPESREKYQRLIRAYLAWLERRKTRPRRTRLAVADIVARWWTWAEREYGWSSRDMGKSRGDQDSYRAAARVLVELYGSLAAQKLRPSHLKTVREAMIAKGWVRTSINSRVKQLARIWKWAAEEELVPAVVAQRLAMLRPLRRQSGQAPEKEPVGPIDWPTVEATLKHLQPMARAMVEIQYLTGCRPEEICRLRPKDLEEAAPCWIYRPGSDQGPTGQHKTAHHGHGRVVLLGPAAQRLLAPWLEGCPEDAVVFSPARLARRPPRLRRDCYTTRTYRQLLRRAAIAAGVQPWGPNRLRHTRATELRKYGIDRAKTILGHSRVETTEIYAEKGIAEAIELMARIG